MIRYRKLGYVALNVSDVARAADFYVSQVGLADAGEASSGGRFLRCSTSHHDLLLCRGSPGLNRVAFEMESAVALDMIVERASALGLPCRPVEPAECGDLRLTRACRIREPHTGLTLEFYERMLEVADPFVPTLAKIQRLGHVVVKTTAYDEAVRFFTEVLGFVVSDVIDGMVTFLRCYPNPFHHSFAISAGRRAGLHHVNFMVTEIDDIGRAIWRFRRNGVQVVHGPGRHPPSGSIFYYFVDPDGLTLEYSFGMEEFTPEGARSPRLLEATQASFDYWGAIPDARKAATGEIEPWTPV